MSIKLSIIGQRLYVELLSRQSALVGALLEGLSKRDSRFGFIKESFDEFLHGEFGLLEATIRLRTITWNSLLEHDGMQSPNTQGNYLNTEETESPAYLEVLFINIINAAIYELLDVFNIDLTLEQAPEVNKPPMTKISLLQDLYEKSKELVPTPEKTISLHNPAINPQKEDNYQYPTRLESSNIRVLCIEPGSKGSSIKCYLETRNLDGGGVEEALSYVWGEPIFDKIIQIDGRSFNITTRLNDILHSLRHEDVTRTIWIDAICINQSNLEEKGHQVRLMRDIYSNALKTTIWLGTWPIEQTIPKLDLTEDPNNILAPVPEKFMGNLMDQYDLVTMLEEYVKYPTARTWDGTRLALSIMLVRCVNIIVKHDWWERMWTIQEVALSPNDPVVHFRGYCFPFSTVISAMDTVTEISDEMDSDDLLDKSDRVSINMHTAFFIQVRHWQVNGRTSGPIHRTLRPEKWKETHTSDSLKRTLPILLSTVDYCRTTDPRDKIFALESLLIKSAGRLINVNYNESTESVFRRITALILNYPETIGILYYKLSIETNNNSHNNASSTSWVHDFAYSDAKKRMIDPEQPTFYGYLLRKNNSPPMYDLPSGQDICFATPKTFFCSGIPVNITLHTKLVPDLSENSPNAFFQFYIDFLVEAIQKSQGTAMADELIEKGISYHTPGDILGFFTLNLYRYEDESRKSRERIAEGLRGITGTYIFITEDFVIGLATAPVQKGDILSIIHRYPHYVFLREVKHQDGESQNAKKHRIVARGAIAESQETMRARIDSGLKGCVFQII